VTSSSMWIVNILSTALINFYPCWLNNLIFSIDTFHLLFYVPIRTRVPQMASSVSHRRAGIVLPPPADDFSYSAVVSAKHTIKNGTLVCSLC
jgi:hypothetical protein